jgi:hypothetical protein
MVLYYASKYSASNAPPKQLIDTNVSSDYKKISALFTLKNKKQNFDVLRQIIEEIPQKTLITAEFSLAKRFSKDDFNSLLFYLGFLTISGSELNYVNLVVPNYVIKELYFDFFGEVLREDANYDIDVDEIRNSIAKIAKVADITDFLNIVTTTLNKLSSRDYMKFDEKYVKIIMITYFMMSKIYYVKSEYEVEDGYIDIAILPRPGVDAPYNAIFEVKYLKKEGYTARKKAIKVKEAKEQMARYATAPELADMTNLLKWVIVFCGDKVVHLERV